MDGDVSSFSSMILLEHLRTDKNWSLGYNFGLGITNQSLRPDLERSMSQTNSVYTSFHFGGILNRKINQNFYLRFEPSILWTDPINSSRGSEKWQLADEDLSFLAQLGLVYKLK